MSTFKHTSKRALSVLLSCLMVVSAISIGFVFPLSVANAAEYVEVVIGVPETVYMTPADNYNTTTTTVKYYVNNTVSSSGALTLDKINNATAGKFYVYGPQISSIDSISVNGANLSGLSPTKSGNLFSDTSFTMSLKNGISSSAIKLLEWSIKVTDTDGKQHTLLAYTVAYDPYLSPIFTAIRNKDTENDPHFCSGLSWVSGIHGIRMEGGYYPKSNFLPLLGGPSTGNGTSNPDGWFSTDQQCGLPTKGGWYQNKEQSQDVVWVFERSAEGFVVVDRSRYDNLKYIPYLTTGLYVTDAQNDESDSSVSLEMRAYIADITGKGGYITTGTGGKSGDDWTPPGEWNTSWNTLLAGSRDSDQNTLNPLFNVAINRAVASTQEDVYIRAAMQYKQNGGGAGAFNSSENDMAVTIMDSYLQVRPVNKSELRNLVVDCVNKYSIKDCFTASSWNPYHEALRAAASALGDPTSTANFTELKNNLSAARNALYTTVYLNGNQGSLNADSSFTVNIGGNRTVSVSPSAQPTRTGYTFNGWTLSENHATGTQGEFQNITVGYNNTLYACWTADQYTITCDANGGTNATDNPTSYDIEHSATLKVPSRTGYTFTGWTGDNGSTPQTTVTIPTGQTGDKSYTANWEANKYTVVYEKGADSATGSVASTNAEYDRSFTVPANGFTNEGHTFTGWKGQNNVTYQPGDTPKNLTAAANGTFTMTAQWSVNSYNVVYDNMLDMQAWQTVLANDPGVDCDITETTDTGFTAKSTAGIDGYTNWSPAMEVEAGKQYVVESHMIGSGYQVFVDWLNSSGDHFQYSNTDDTATSTFTAPADAKYMRIRFDANVSGNSITCSDVRVAKVDDNPLLNRSNVTVSRSGKLYNYGSDYTSDLPSASRTGYEFAGWYTDYDATTPVVSGSTVSDSTLHLWSKWTQNVYNISYSMDGGTNHADNPASYTVEDEIILKAPEKQGYTFTGWTGSNGTTPQTSVTIPKGSTGNRNYTANWSIKTFTVIFDCANDTPASTHYVQYNNAVNTLKPVNPEKESTAQFSYTFTGWVSDTGTVYGPNDTLPAATADVTYTAQYSQTTRTYTVYWKNSDGSELETDMNVPYGTVPAYNEADPTKAPDEQYQYTWSGWESGGQTYLKTDTLPAIEGDTIFTATYSHATRQYTVTWYDEDRTTVLDTQTKDHGTSVTYEGNPPTKQGNAQYSYSFNTFKDDNGTAYPSDAAFTLNGDISLYAFYTQSINKYTVTWVGAAGNLEVDENVPYGTAPSFDLNGGRNPIKEQTDAATYEFSGWKSSVTGETYATVSLLPPVTGNVTFTAQFEEHVRQYNVSWKNWNGDALGADLLDYGAVPAYSGTETPARTPTTTKEYVFAGWRSSGGTQYPAGTALPQVTGAETYTAYYTEQVRMYTVRWVDENGNELEVDTKAYAYNDHPTYDSGESLIPVKTDTDEYHYEWGGWRDTVSGSSYTPASLVAARVTKDTTYQVWYKAIKKQYTVTWIIRDSNGAETSDTTEVDYGVSPTHEEPEHYVVNEGGSDYYYTFSGWKSNGTLYSPTDTLPIVTGPVTYTAEYARGTHRHHFVAGDITVEPTCTETGTQTWYCDYSGGCNETFEQTVDALGHLWDEGTVDRAPTCVATGTKLYHCTRNGCAATKTEVIAKDTVNGHKWIKDDDLSTEPSCEYTGTYYYHCEYNENHTKREIIPANGHAYTETVVAPTCVAQGYTLHVCSRCDRSYKDNYVEATGHDYDANEDGTVTTDDAVAVRQPDCINSGIWRYECKTCHTTHDELVPTLIDQLGDVPAAHRYHSEITRQATCTLGEKTTYECEVCHKSYSEDTHDPLGHNYGEYDRVEPTCTERGSVSQTCTRCGKTVRVENLPALRHDWGEGVVTQPATCAGDGIMTYTCTREGCGVTKTEVIPMTPDSHVYDGGVVTTPPTYSRTGLMTYTCTVCGHSYTEEIGRLERDDDDDPNHGGAGDAGNSGGNSTHHNSEGRCSMCDKYEAIQSSNSPGITKLFYSIVHFIVHLFATFSF